jgi:hypothetical protein
VAEAIAAVSRNKASGLVNNDSMTQQEIPGIIFIGANPTLYRIKITNELLKHLNDGTYPKGHPTFVRKLVQNTTGMEENLQDRMLIFKLSGYLLGKLIQKIVQVVRSTDSGDVLQHNKITNNTARPCCG